MSPLKLRCITAVLVLAALVTLLYYGTQVLFLMVLSGLGLVLAQEWGTLFAIKSWWKIGAFYILGYCLSVAAYQVSFTILPLYLAVGFLMFAFVLLAWCMYFERTAKIWEGPIVLKMLLGYGLFLPMLLAFLHLLSQAKPQNAFLLGSLVLIVSGADTAAFFVGRAVGKHRLAPKISPGKSIEGVLGALCAAVLIAFFLFPYFGTGHPLLWLSIVMITTLLSVLGDLSESMLKRFRGIKDSGRCLPGHGGLWDRLDGFTLAAPFYVLGLQMIGSI